MARQERRATGKIGGSFVRRGNRRSEPQRLSVFGHWRRRRGRRGAIVWPLIDQMNPDASTLALASIEVDISAIQEGQIVTVKWRGKPVFIRHRTVKEIEEAVDTPIAELRDPQTDAERVKKAPWLIVVGICTHLGCVPLGHEGQYDGWKCPCHGSVYDTSGRIRQGPAPSILKFPNMRSCPIRKCGWLIPALWPIIVSWNPASLVS